MNSYDSVLVKSHRRIVNKNKKAARLAKQGQGWVDPVQKRKQDGRGAAGQHRLRTAKKEHVHTFQSGAESRC